MTTTLLIYVVVIALFVYRLARPQRISVTRLWIMPILLFVLTALSVYGSQVMAPRAPWQTGLAFAGGLLLGSPLGLLRGKHSQVTATDRKNVMFVRSSPAIVFLWLGAFVARAAIRYLVPGADTAEGVWGTGLMAFAVGALVTSYYAIYVKYRSLERQTTPTV